MANIVLSENEHFTVASGNIGRVFGGAKSAETVTVRRGATAELQSDFTAHSDNLQLPGQAANYSVTTAGATVTLTNGTTRAQLPAGNEATRVTFADAAFDLRATTLPNPRVMLGSADVTSAEGETVDAANASGPGHGGLPSYVLTEGSDRLSGNELDNVFLAPANTVQETDVVRGAINSTDRLRVEANDGTFEISPDMNLDEIRLNEISAAPSTKDIIIRPGNGAGPLFDRTVRIDLSGDTAESGTNTLDLANLELPPPFDKFNAFVTGSSGSDNISGTDTADLIRGGLGADRLTGNGGEDRFAGSLLDLDQDTITDFGAGDSILISEINLSDMTVRTNTVDSGLEVTLSGPESTANLFLEGFAGSTLRTGATENGDVLIRPGGEEFQLTSDADDVTGTALPDTILAPSGTLQDTDTIDGKDGTDRIQLAPNGSAYSVGSGPWSALTSVERIETSANAKAIDLTFGAGLDDAGLQRIDLSGDTESAGTNTIDLSSLDLAPDAVKQVKGSAGADRVFLSTASQLDQLTTDSYYGQNRPDGLLDGGKGKDTLSFGRSQDPNATDVNLNNVQGFEVFEGSESSDTVTLDTSGFKELRTGAGGDNVRLSRLEFSDEGKLLIGDNDSPAPSLIDLGPGPDSSRQYDADSLSLDLSEVVSSDLDNFDVTEFSSGTQLLDLGLSWSDAPDRVMFTTDSGSANTITVPSGLNAISVRGGTGPAVSTYDFSNIERPTGETAFRIDTSGLTQQATLTVRGTDQDDDIQTSGNARQDIVYSGGGEDDISGNGGDDELRGGAGDDDIRGGAGDDRLKGGLGTDNVRGGSGSDTFIGSIADLEGDTIEDFRRNDKILVENVAEDNLDASIDSSFGELVVTLDNNEATATFDLRDVGFALETATAEEGGVVIRAAPTFSLDALGGTADDPANVPEDIDEVTDVEAGAFTFTDDAMEASNTQIEGYGSDDILKLNGVRASDVDVTVANGSTRLSFDDGNGTASQIKLMGVGGNWDSVRDFNSNSSVGDVVAS